MAKKIKLNKMNFDTIDLSQFSTGKLNEFLRILESRQQFEKCVKIKGELDKRVPVTA